MNNTYEVVVSPVGLALFEDAFSRYMARLNFRHMRIRDRLGGRTSHEFRKDHCFVSFTASNEG